MRTRCLFLMLAILCYAPTSPLRGADPPTAAVPEAVRALVGTCAGSWTLFGIDDKGQVVKRMAWTDAIKAANPERTGDRAFVTTTDDMTFEGAPAPFKVQGKEGYFLTKDGGLGDYFIE